MNDFKKCLDFANSEKLHPFWLHIYKEMFPNIAHMTGTVDNMKLQKKGIDRVIVLENNRTLYIDEKLRRSVYNDILLEHISVQYPDGRIGAKGWMHKARDIDYLAYGWKPNRTVYLFPWPQLQRAWKYYHKEWIKQYGVRNAPNNSYVTVNVPVPIGVLKNKVADAMRLTAPESVFHTTDHS